MDLDKLVENVDVKSVIKSSVGSAKRALLGEAYVAEPKQYKQVSELISQKTKQLHTTLYNDYVETLNRVSAELDTAKREEANARHSDFRSLKLDETYNMNAVFLHELYFANAFDPHSECFVDSLPYMKLSSVYGTFDAWQADFMACAQACGNGWAVTCWNMYLKNYCTTVISNHSQDVMVGMIPLVVYDGWEHANVIDYGTNKNAAVVAFMRSIDWNVVTERFERIEKIARIL